MGEQTCVRLIEIPEDKFIQMFLNIFSKIFVPVLLSQVLVQLGILWVFEIVELLLLF